MECSSKTERGKDLMLALNKTIDQLDVGSGVGGMVMD